MMPLIILFAVPSRTKAHRACDFRAVLFVFGGGHGSLTRREEAEPRGGVGWHNE